MLVLFKVECMDDPTEALAISLMSLDELMKSPSSESVSLSDMGLAFVPTPGAYCVGGRRRVVVVAAG